MTFKFMIMILGFDDRRTLVIKRGEKDETFSRFNETFSVR